MPQPPAILKRHRLIGVLAVLISLATWTMQWTGVVEPCPYCAVQRTVIGLLGLLLLVPPRASWTTLYVGGVVAFFGAAVAAAQHFNGWAAIQKGTFKGFSPLYANGFLLSACALAMIVGEWMLLRHVQSRGTSQR